MDHPDKSDGLGKRRALTRRRLGVGIAASCLLFLAFVVWDFAGYQAKPPAVLELVLDAPSQASTSSEPLIVTGKTGDGDFLYVQFAGPDTVVFGYDSWGAGGPQSPAIKIKPNTPLLLRIAMPSLVSLATSTRSTTLRVEVVGAAVWEAKVSSHDCTAASVHWAYNPIGGSSCSKEFSGALRNSAGKISGSGMNRYYTTGQNLALYARDHLRRLPYYIAGYIALALIVILVNWAAAWNFLVRKSLVILTKLSGPPVEDAVPGSCKANPKIEACRWLDWIPTKPFLAGLVLGFMLCVASGFLVSKRAMFDSFLRFYYPIVPQTYFYPTASELTSYVERTVPADKTLVLVGGASYFRGAGQNPDELWTRELQTLLGDRYAVINYAVDQAGSPAFAGVIYQVLARKYPRIVYISSSGIFSTDPFDGGSTYRYLYWDAYYKGMIPLTPKWRQYVERERRFQMQTPEGKELHLGKWMDARTYACDLWTYLGYHVMFTVWSDAYAQSPFKARGHYPEGSNLHLADEQQQIRKDPEYVATMEERALYYSRLGYDRSDDGHWSLRAETPRSINNAFLNIFPEERRSRCLIVLLHMNPYFMKQLTAEDRQRLLKTTDLAQGVIEGLGFQVVQAGADFSQDDFLDAGHFMPSGGNKIAKIVAQKVRSMHP